MSRKDPVAWHSAIAEEFHAKYSDNPMFKERLAVWSDAIGSAIPAKASVADLGCGPGILSIVAGKNARSVIGVDGSEEMVRVARKVVDAAGASNVKIVQGRLESFAGQLTEPVDAIISSSVVEYLDDPESFIATCAEKLREGGVLLVSVPNDASCYRWLERCSFTIVGRPRYLGHVSGLGTSSKIARVLERSGLQVRASRSFGRVPIASSLARFLGLARFVDTMILFVAHKVEVGDDLIGKRI